MLPHQQEGLQEQPKTVVGSRKDNGGVAENATEMVEAIANTTRVETSAEVD